MPIPDDLEAAEESLTKALTVELRLLKAKRNSELEEAYAYLLTTRGKRLRGRLLLAAAWQGPSFDSPQVGKAAVAIELLHLASLAHDDVIDSGTMRRGAPTIGARFGQKAAAFAGASLFARAVEVMVECNDATWEPFAETACEMCEGGMREFSGLFDIARTTSDYYQTAGEKTASAFRLAAYLGATLAGADEAVTAGAAEFGYEFGMAYQIWDDLLDLLTDPVESGKTPGSDLRHGVYTLPVILAVKENSAISRRLGAAIDSPVEQASLVASIKDTGGAIRASAAAEEHAKHAASLTDSLPRPKPMRDLLDHVRESHLEPLR